MMLASLNLTDTKCGRCHLLERIYRERRTNEEWTAIVKRMIDIEPAWISHDEGTTIREYLISAHGLKGPARSAAGKNVDSPQGAAAAVNPIPENLSAEDIFQTRCTECHDHDRVYKKARDIGGDKEKWKIVVERMKKNGAPLLEPDIPKMVDFLAALNTQ